MEVLPVMRAERDRPQLITHLALSNKAFELGYVNTVSHCSILAVHSLIMSPHHGPVSGLELAELADDETLVWMKVLHVELKSSSRSPLRDRLRCVTQEGPSLPRNGGNGRRRIRGSRRGHHALKKFQKKSVISGLLNTPAEIMPNKSPQT